MFKNKNLKFISFGEVLFDDFGKDKKIGGAPLNIALRIKSFGFPVAMISAVGADESGKEILEFIQQKEIHMASVSIVPEYQTGLVKVSLDEEGVADYEIGHPVAWDAISLSDNTKKIVNNADVIIYGSLASRDEVSKDSLLQILKKSNGMKAFDVNLRPPHYNVETLKELIQQADFIKFNEEELLEISGLLGSNDILIEKNIKFIHKITNVQTICVTRGGAGAVLFHNNQLYYNGGHKIQVVDTVGAGDSFLGSLLCHLLSNGNPQNALDFACTVGGIVASSAGANPNIDLGETEAILNRSKIFATKSSF
ncbi:carbohydrate kinase [Gramella sp. AN32]|uniref:Carbohydrate kinase family protein n=1 Tax=Christiangramia antarctica TaxID=2058158 RepID=A0ABW5XB52_9FLAO|nr:carbohydrate kinase [Gramella sp. AN32]MCM4156433.1 carbohydrate kinase [Gramella sp. AN32]